MRMIAVGLAVVFAQGCIGSDSLTGIKFPVGTPAMNDTERFKCDMDSLRPGCQYLVPRQQVNGELK